jgi:hypothetical protein
VRTLLRSLKLLGPRDEPRKTDMKIAKAILNGALLTAAFIALPTLSHATPITTTTETFQLTSDHCDPQGVGCLGGQPSAGTITVTDNGDGTLSFDVTLTSGFTFVNGGFQAGFGFNLVGNPTIDYTGVTTGFAPVADPETAGMLHMDGTGDFEYGLNCTICGSGGSGNVTGPLDFTISAGTALTLASLEQNANGQFFAVDVQGANGNTGGVDASVGSGGGGGGGGGNVPEPQTLALLGIGLVGAWAMRARSARRNS